MRLKRSDNPRVSWTLKRIPNPVLCGVRRAAQERGIALNAYIVAAFRALSEGAVSLDALEIKSRIERRRKLLAELRRSQP